MPQFGAARARPRNRPATALCEPQGDRPQRNRHDPEPQAEDLQDLRQVLSGLELITGRRRIDAPEVEGIQVLEPIEIPAMTELRPGLALAANRVLAQALAASPGNRFATDSA